MAKEKSKKGYADIAVGKQRIVTWLAYAAIIALSIITSLGDFLFDFDKFNPSKFAAKVSISICIVILVMLMSSKDGQITNEDRKTGNYFEAKERFKAKRNMIVNLDWFRQWADGPLYERERKAAIVDALAEYGIAEYEYMMVSDADFNDLRNGPKECAIGDKTKPLAELSDPQWKVVKYLRTGFRFKPLEYSYFTSSANAGGYAYYANLRANQRKRKIFAIAYRVFMVVVTTAVFMLAAFKESGGGAAQIAYDTSSRLATLLSSAFMGYSLANDEMRENISAIEFKIEKIDQYLVETQSGEFVPVSRDERIREKIREMERQKAEEAKRKAESTIIPEVVEPKQNDPGYMEIEMTEEEYKAFAESK
jgi:hypothetical protein